MTETIIRYSVVDKNQVKIAKATALFAERLNNWLSGKPSGQLVLSVEVNANQGGLGDMFIEHKERGRVF
jgi:hypothetical protein